MLPQPIGQVLALAIVESPAIQMVTLAGLGEALLGVALLGRVELGGALLGVLPGDEGPAHGVGDGVVVPPQTVPLKVNAAGTGFAVVHAPLKPKLTLPLVATAPL